VLSSHNSNIASSVLKIVTGEYEKHSPHVMKECEKQTEKVTPFHRTDPSAVMQRERSSLAILYKILASTRFMHMRL
jgi:hypothetical protein